MLSGSVCWKIEDNEISVDCYNKENAQWAFCCLLYDQKIGLSGQQISKNGT